jgi:hypothetical protein
VGFRVRSGIAARIGWSRCLAARLPRMSVRIVRGADGLLPRRATAAGVASGSGSGIDQGVRARPTRPSGSCRAVTDRTGDQVLCQGDREIGTVRWIGRWSDNGGRVEATTLPGAKRLGPSRTSARADRMTPDVRSLGPENARHGGRPVAEIPRGGTACEGGTCRPAILLRRKDGPKDRAPGSTRIGRPSTFNPSHADKLPPAVASSDPRTGVQCYEITGIVIYRDRGRVRWRL